MKPSVAALLIFFCATSLCHAQPADAQVDSYPDTTWLRYATPEEAGWSSKRIEEVRAFADSLGSKAVMLVHDGAIVTEWGDTRGLAPIRSIRKTLISPLVGIAVAEGTIDTAATLAELGIDDTPPLTEAEKRARVLHLLTTSSGVYHDAAGEAPRTQKPERGSAAPGEQWYYNNWDFNALGTIYEQKVGTRVFEAFEEQVAEPIGMEDYQSGWGHYFVQPWRSDHPTYSLWMTAHDMARFGLLYLREGRWKGEQVVPAEWVEASRQIHMEVPYESVAGYGLSWWIPGGQLRDYGTYLAAGAGSQAIMVVPELDLVFVHRATAVLERGVSGLEAEEMLLRLIDARTESVPKQPALVPASE